MSLVVVGLVFSLGLPVQELEPISVRAFEMCVGVYQAMSLQIEAPSE